MEVPGKAPGGDRGLRGGRVNFKQLAYELMKRLLAYEFLMSEQTSTWPTRVCEH